MSDESEALRQLAHQMAAVADSKALLEILCTAASRQCGGTASAVVKAEGDAGVIMGACGGLASAVGRRFPLRGSLLREMLLHRDVVMVSDFSRTARPLSRVVPEVELGPMMVAPLIAHDALLGGIAVARGAGANGFSPEQRGRLRTIADHAALALWKAQLLEQAQAADRAKSRFLATVSHELRTPLTALTGYEELLADEVLGGLTEAQADVLERMRSVTHHLTAMIEEVLMFSSLEVGREVVRPSEFLVADLVHAAAAVIEPLARQKYLALELELPRAPIRVISDIDKVRQIMVNLAANAVKFTMHGDVRMGAASADGEVRLFVQDTGIGITRQDIERLFQPFSQLDSGLTRRHGGTGLGLYISRRFAELLGGRIDVESEPGVGSTFTLVLPA